VAQICRFRDSEAYRRRNTSYQPTRPTIIPIGERRKPRPRGRPGYLRIDTVHQGDRNGNKGVCHINAVDEMTQWEIVAATPQISEHWLIPLLRQLLEQFPFTIRGFHFRQRQRQLHSRQTAGQAADRTDQITRVSNGRQRAGGVEERRARSQTHGFHSYRGAPRRSRRSVSSPVSESVRDFHRPYAIPEIVGAPNGKRRRVYRRWATPFEIFRQTPQCESYLREDITLGGLQRFALAQSDTEAAIAMQHAKRKLLAGIAKQSAGIPRSPAKPKSAMEMPVGWERRKTRKRFPSVPTAPGNRCRDFHIPPAPTGSPSPSKLKPKGVPCYPPARLLFRLILR